MSNQKLPWLYLLSYCFLNGPFHFITNNYLYLAVTSQFKNHFNLYFYFMCMVVLTACMSVHLHIYAVPAEVRKGCQIFWDRNHVGFGNQT